VALDAVKGLFTLKPEGHWSRVRQEGAYKLTVAWKENAQPIELFAAPPLGVEVQNVVTQVSGKVSEVKFELKGAAQIGKELETVVVFGEKRDQAISYQFPMEAR